MDKIAFMFLLYDKIQHQKLWEDFFSEDPHGRRHNIYSHPKEINEKTPKWIVENRVRTVKTGWCSEGLLKALCQMLKVALKDKTNKYFALVSGTCIPLLKLDKTYKKISRSKKARLFYYKQNLFEGKDHWYAYQWVILNRKVAKDLLKLYDPKNSRSKKFIRSQRKLYKDHGAIIDKNLTIKEGKNCTWYGGCPDELYPINWFIKLYGSPSSEKFKKNIKKQETHFILWPDDYEHPYVINKKQLEKNKKEMCSTNHIFARKFTKSSAEIAGMSC